MALIGLRMMPTFPSPPLKFRTAGLPRYGFKASLSVGAFQRCDGLKSTPRHAPVIALFVPGLRALPCRERRVGSGSHPSDTSTRRCASGPRRSTPGVLGSGASSALSLHRRLLRPHPSVSQARDDFAAWPVIRRAFAVRERLGDPGDLPYFRCRAVHTCHRPYAGGSATLSRCSCAPRYQAPRLQNESPPTTSVSASNPRREEHFGAASFALGYGPRVCLALLTGYTQMESRESHLCF
jgi:hypothetical protein